jgi:ADP-heptose:LPS heptosyltransferase
MKPQAPLTDEASILVPQAPLIDEASILVIKLGALGDFVLAFAAFAAIRARHLGSITLLTTRQFAPLAKRAPWFDNVVTEGRPPWWDLPGVWRLRGHLRRSDLVYDLQTSSRSSFYFRLAGRPIWSGIAPGCALPHDNPERDRMHTLERQREQLDRAGVPPVKPDLTWLAGARPANLPENFVLLIPGAAAHRPAKRWPAEKFAALAQRVTARGLTPVVLGSAGERRLAQIIRTACPSAIDLTGQTDLVSLAAIAARARLAVGNDTGPMHLAAAIGCPCVVLFSGASDPALTAPRGPDGTWPVVLREFDLAALPVDRVAAALP